MRQIALEEAKPGDEVAQPVKNERGMIILPKGAKLSVGMLDKLRRMGVRELIVEGDDPNAPPPKTMNQLLEELELRFEGLDHEPLMMVIKKKAREHLLQQKGL